MNLKRGLIRLYLSFCLLWVLLILWAYGIPYDAMRTARSFWWVEPEQANSDPAFVWEKAPELPDDWRLIPAAPLSESKATVSEHDLVAEAAQRRERAVAEIATFLGAMFGPPLILLGLTALTFWTVRGFALDRPPRQ